MLRVLMRLAFTSLTTDHNRVVMATLIAARAVQKAVITGHCAEDSKLT